MGGKTKFLLTEEEAFLGLQVSILDRLFLLETYSSLVIITEADPSSIM
jgi:hypothetical protein